MAPELLAALARIDRKTKARVAVDPGSVVDALRKLGATLAADTLTRLIDQDIKTQEEAQELKKSLP